MKISAKSALSIGIALAVFALPSLWSRAGAQSTPNPTADQIIDRYITATGGRGAWMKIHSRTSLGTIDLPSVGASGTVMIHEKAPNRVLQVVILQGAVFRQGFDGEVAWSEDPAEGLKVKSGPELAEMKRESDFYHVVDIKKFYSKLVATGQEQIGDESAWAVEGVDLDGVTEKMYFDTKTGLLVRSVIQRHVGDKLTTFQQDLADYRQVDGVKLPFEVSQTGGDAAFAIKISEFRHNVDLEDSEFAKPDVQ
jgi:photosynthetic reaction center cytochrome c subunit